MFISILRMTQVQPVSGSDVVQSTLTTVIQLLSSYLGIILTLTKNWFIILLIIYKRALECYFHESSLWNEGNAVITIMDFNNEEVKSEYHSFNSVHFQCGTSYDYLKYYFALIKLFSPQKERGEVRDVWPSFDLSDRCIFFLKLNKQ